MLMLMLMLMFLMIKGTEAGRRALRLSLFQAICGLDATDLLLIDAGREAVAKCLVSLAAKLPHQI